MLAVQNRNSSDFQVARVLLGRNASPCISWTEALLDRLSCLLGRRRGRDRRGIDIVPSRIVRPCAARCLLMVSRILRVSSLVAGGRPIFKRVVASGADARLRSIRAKPRIAWLSCWVGIRFRFRTRWRGGELRPLRNPASDEQAGGTDLDRVRNASMAVSSASRYTCDSHRWAASPSCQMRPTSQTLTGLGSDLLGRAPKGKGRLFTGGRRQ